MTSSTSPISFSMPLKTQFPLPLSTPPLNGHSGCRLMKPLCYLLPHQSRAPPVSTPLEISSRPGKRLAVHPAWSPTLTRVPLPPPPPAPTPISFSMPPTTPPRAGDFNCFPGVPFVYQYPPPPPHPTLPPSAPAVDSSETGENARVRGCNVYPPPSPPPKPLALRSQT